ncbi:MAG TPA: hypothetical protein VFM37_15130, partial [Pseudonocardiaceae bacterium]|nr:hypothetical protein [Pseudonocardiaceae bacterium]
MTGLEGLVPVPVSVEPLAGGHELGAGSAVRVAGDALGVAQPLAAWLRRSTGFPVPVGADGDLTLA